MTTAVSASAPTVNRSCMVTMLATTSLVSVAAAAVFATLYALKIAIPLVAVLSTAGVLSLALLIEVAILLSLPKKLSLKPLATPTTPTAPSSPPLLRRPAVPRLNLGEQPSSPFSSHSGNGSDYTIDTDSEEEQPFTYTQESPRHGGTSVGRRSSVTIEEAREIVAFTKEELLQHALATLKTSNVLYVPEGSTPAEVATAAQLATAINLRAEQLDLTSGTIPQVQVATPDSAGLVAVLPGAVVQVGDQLILNEAIQLCTGVLATGATTQEHVTTGVIIIQHTVKTEQATALLSDAAQTESGPTSQALMQAGHKELCDALTSKAAAVASSQALDPLTAKRLHKEAGTVSTSLTPEGDTTVVDNGDGTATVVQAFAMQTKTVFTPKQAADFKPRTEKEGPADGSDAIHGAFAQPAARPGAQLGGTPLASRLIVLLDHYGNPIGVYESAHPPVVVYYPPVFPVFSHHYYHRHHGWHHHHRHHWHHDIYHSHW